MTAHTLYTIPQGHRMKEQPFAGPRVRHRHVGSGEPCSERGNGHLCTTAFSHEGRFFLSKLKSVLNSIRVLHLHGELPNLLSRPITIPSPSSIHGLGFFFPPLCFSASKVHVPIREKGIMHQLFPVAKALPRKSSSKTKVCREEE